MRPRPPPSPRAPLAHVERGGSQPRPVTRSHCPLQSCSTEPRPFRKAQGLCGTGPELPQEARNLANLAPEGRGSQPRRILFRHGERNHTGRSSRPKVRPGPCCCPALLDGSIAALEHSASSSLLGVQLHSAKQVLPRRTPVDEESRCQLPATQSSDRK